MLIFKVGSLIAAIQSHASENRYSGLLGTTIVLASCVSKSMA